MYKFSEHAHFQIFMSSNHLFWVRYPKQIKSKNTKNNSSTVFNWQKEVIQECAKYRIKSTSTPNATTNNNTNDTDGDVDTDVDADVDDEVVPFEMVVLDNALNATTNKFNQNLTRSN